jgi:hypothetical protein
MIVYGTAVLWCLVQAGGLAVLVFLPRADDLTGMLAILVQMSNLVIVVAAYFVGRWVGTRCSQRGVITICLIAALAATSLVVADTLLFAPDEAYTGVFKQERFGVRDNLTRIGRILPFTIVPLFIGYWRGRKQRLSKYLHYLLGVLPAETRDVTVELAFDEAKKVAGRARLAVS